jgi:hypothetical protein
MIAEFIKLERSAFEIDRTVRNDTLYVIELQKNYSQFRSIRDNEVLIKFLTWYVDEFCNRVQKIRFASFAYDNVALQPDTLPVTRGYVETRYGKAAKREVMELIGEYRKRWNNFRAVETQYERTQNPEQRKILEKEMEGIKMNRFSQLLEKEPIKKFFNPSKPDESDRYHSPSTPFKMPFGM